jgi:hypothetical protein
MTQSTIYFVVGLAVLLVAGFMVAQQYRRDHPEVRVTEWLDFVAASGAEGLGTLPWCLRMAQMLAL